MTLPVAQPPTSGKQLISFDSANQNPELLYNIHFPLDDNPVAGPSLLPSGSHNSGQTQTLNTQQKNKNSMKNIVPKRAVKKCWKCEMEDCAERICAQMPVLHVIQRNVKGKTEDTLLIPVKCFLRLRMLINLHSS